MQTQGLDDPCSICPLDGPCRSSDQLPKSLPNFAKAPATPSEVCECVALRADHLGTVVVGHDPVVAVEEHVGAVLERLPEGCSDVVFPVGDIGVDCAAPGVPVLVVY